MDRSHQDPLADLRANTLTWIAVVLWLAWAYLGQTPAGGPYTDTIRGIFEAILELIIPLVSLLIVAAWIVALRERRRERAKQ